MSTFNLEIVTPTQILKTDNVSYLRCPGVDGLFGVLSGHRDALIALSLGEIKISQDKSDTIYATSGGLQRFRATKLSCLLKLLKHLKILISNELRPH